MRHSHRVCTHCRIRWPQGKHGLCFRCLRELGDTRTGVERQKERVDRLKPLKQPPVPAEPPAPRRVRTVTINGTEYVVTYDGT